ncbi:hypothetical protein BHE74_00009622 [Ensete ventricosum]|nr:hypothetical protein BHE74_00009622 [Ensete ventricosum]
MQRQVTTNVTRQCCCGAALAAQRCCLAAHLGRLLTHYSNSLSAVCFLARAASGFDSTPDVTLNRFVMQVLLYAQNSRLVLVRAIPIQMLVSPSLVPNLRSLRVTPLTHYSNSLSAGRYTLSRYTLSGDKPLAAKQLTHYML